MPSAPNRVSKLGPALAGALSLLGVSVIAGAAHSWIVPVTLRPDWSKNAAARTPGNTAPDSVAHVGTPDGHADNGAAAPGGAADDGHYIDLVTARDMLVNEGALFLDARTADEYEASHVASAMHLTAEMISSGRSLDRVTELVENYGYDHPIVIYCHGGDCDASDNVAKLLLPMGFRNLRVMKAGFVDWRSAGYEVE